MSARVPEQLEEKLSQLGITSADFVHLSSLANAQGYGRKHSMGAIPREEDKKEAIMKERCKELAESYADVLSIIGEDPDRQGTKSNRAIQN